MGKRDDVILLCDGGKQPYRNSEVKRASDDNERHRAMFVFVIVVLVLLSVLLLHPGLRYVVKTSMGHSERDSAIAETVIPESSKVTKKTSFPQYSMTVDLSDPEASEEPVRLRVKVDTEVEDSLDYDDEVEGLRGHVGNETPHPDSVAFVLPLRDHVGNQGVRFAKKLKEILENARKAYEQEIYAANATDSIPSLPLHLPTILRNDSITPPSHVLVRDSKGDFELARQLTQHFYEEHGTTRFFGYLTDEEAMAAALWARVRAPGARLITPTAISPYLDSAANVLRVQPSAKVLAAALADLLITLDLTRPLMVVRASLHTDAFVALLRPHGIKPSQVIHYYETTRFEDLAEKIRKSVLALKQPVLLLGDAESWELIHIADSYFPCLWICPFPTQLHDHIRTTKSELIYFMYRAYDDKPGYFMKENPLLEPNESMTKASLALLNGKRRTWRGSYVVVASVTSKSLKSRTKILGGADLIPIMQYDVTRRGISRRVYHELQLTEQLLRPLTSGSQCNVVVRYIQELTGKLMRTELPIDFLQPTLLIPAGRGAQMHLDCPRHHVDLRCSSPKDSWSPIKCRGTIQGIHHYQAYCGNDIGVTFSATKGCMLSKALVCLDGQTLGCKLSGLCSSVSHSRMMYNCDGIPVPRL